MTPPLPDPPPPRRRALPRLPTPALAVAVAVLLVAGSAVMADEAEQRRGQRISAEGAREATPTGAPPPARAPTPRPGEPTAAASPDTPATPTTAANGRRPGTESATNQPPPSRATVPPPAPPPSAPGQGRIVPPGTEFYTSEPVSAANGRLKVSLRYFAPSRPVTTARAVRWLVNWDDAVGYISQIRISFGDGAHYVSKPPYSCSQGRDESTMAHPSGVHEAAHAYRHPGQYSASVWVTTSSCSGGDATTEVSMPGPAIEAGASPSNGPDGGYVIRGVQSRPGDDAALWKLHLEAGDSDGYVSRIELVWGDGDRQVLDFPLGECIDPGTHWPSSVRHADVEHRFQNEDRAQHTVVITSTSVGCDGADPQTIGGSSYARSSQQW